MRGLVFVFEGCDKVGKSIQSKHLVKMLQDISIATRHYQFPNRKTASGKMIDDILKGRVDTYDAKALHLLFALNRFEILAEMQDLIDQGVCLVIDRYKHSGIAYSAAKGVEMSWSRCVEEGLLIPDVVFYLNAPVEVTSRRMGFGDEMHETIEFQKKVREAFDHLHYYETNFGPIKTKWVKLYTECNENVTRNLISNEAMETIQLCKYFDF